MRSFGFHTVYYHCQLFKKEMLFNKYFLYIWSFPVKYFYILHICTKKNGEGNGNPLQYSCLENSMDRGAWQATVHGVAKSWTWLSDKHTLKKKRITILCEPKIILSPSIGNRVLWKANTQSTQAYKVCNTHWMSTSDMEEKAVEKWKCNTRLCYVLSCFSHVWLCDPMDCSPPGSSVHGILQVRILEWVAIRFSRGSSWPRDWTCISCSSCIAGRLFTSEPPGKPTEEKAMEKWKCNTRLAI